VSFLQVTESSSTDPVPLFGAPDPFVTGLDFDPIGFVSSASSGAADVTSGQLNFTVHGSVSAQEVVAIDSISLFEAGDYTLGGTGTAATQALAGAIMRLTVTEIDGMPVTPINLVPVNASVGFNLAANPGIAQPWSLGLNANVLAQLPGATRIEVVINNDLMTASEPGSAALMAKKEFQIGGQFTRRIIPEPTALALASLMVCGVGLRRRGAIR
jgi:hypothetical protein